MEISIPVAIPQAQLPTEFSLRGQNATVQGQNVENGDFWSLIFQQLASGATVAQNGVKSEEDTENSEMLQLLKKQLDEDGTELSMQMLSEMLNGTVGFNPIAFQQMTSNPEAYEQNIALLRTASNGQSDYVLLKPDVITESNAEISAAQKETAVAQEAVTAQTNLLGSAEQAKNNADFLVSLQQDKPAKMQTFDIKASKPLKGEEKLQKTENIIAVKENSAESKKVGILEEQNQFERSVKSILKTVKASEDASNKNIDIEKLQNEVNAGVHLNGGVADFKPFTLTAAEKTQDISGDIPVDFVNQIETGIKTGLQADKNEFTFKLKPEGLGEITVKMVEESGKIALNIIASTSKVEKLLNGELATLQQSLKPYNVEVQPAVTQTSAASSYSAFNYGQNLSQQHSHQQFQNQERLTTWQASNQPEPVHSDELQELLTTAKQYQKASGLDTYI